MVCRKSIIFKVYFSSFFSPGFAPYFRMSDLRSSEQEILKVPFARTAYYKKSFSVTGPKLWNALPLEIRKSTSLATFKTSVKKYYLNKQLNET